MKHIYLAALLFCGTLFGQSYHKEWDKVLRLEESGKIKSANGQVSKIYRKAERDENGPQLIKCFFYQSKYLFTFEPKAQFTVLKRLRERSETAKTPNRALFNLIYAKCLSAYSQRNSGTIYHNADRDSLPGENIELWSLKDYERTIERAYTRSLADSAALKKIPISEYEQVFDYRATNDSAQTLFEYVVAQNIGYYQSGAQYRDDGLHDFLNARSEAVLMGTPADFTHANFDTVAYKSERQALLLMQALERSQPSAKNRLDRILWVFNIRDERRLKALQQLKRQIQGTDMTDDLDYALASYYQQNANKQNNSDYLAKAVLLLDGIIDKDRRSNAGLKAIGLKESILQKRFHATVPKKMYEKENVRAFVSFQNVDTVVVSCFRTDSKNQLSERYDRNIGSEIAAKGLVAQYVQNYVLPKSGDHFEHTTEILMPNLPLGTYAIRFSAKNGGSELESYRVITVSNLAYLSRTDGDQTLYTIVNRKTGKPIPEVAISVDSDSVRATTDTLGNARLRLASDHYRYSNGWIARGNDSIAFDYYTYRYDKPQTKASTRSELFLDRAIYRPGQTVYFKGVLVRRDSLGKSVAQKIRVKLIAFDSNRKEVFSTMAETNEFGSYSGQFTLPQHGITGDYTLQAVQPETGPDFQPTDIENRFRATSDFSPGYLRFKVEEYKRPKFEVAFEPVKQTLTLEKPVIVYGNAKALAGSAISGAKVTYSVRLSEIRYKPEESDYYRPYETEEMNELIVEDSTQTDENGHFPIKFNASFSEDEDVKDRLRLPVYNYLIKASITDVNGETRSSETTLNIGLHTLALGFETGDLGKRKGNKIRLSTTDLNGKFKPAAGQLRMKRIRRQAAHFKNGNSNTPEIPGFTAEEFHNLFPNEVLESELTKSLDSSFVKTIAVNSAKATDMEVDLSDLAPGVYQVVFSARDEFGNRIEYSRDLPLTDPTEKFPADKLFSAEILNTDPLKDGFALVRVASQVKDLNFRILAANNDSVFFERSVQLSGNRATVKIPLSRQFKYGISFTTDAFYDGEFLSQNHWIPIPEPAKELTLETVSYRNLIEPGSKQTWSFRLKAKNTSLDSEVVASMYDMSLDAFQQTDWRSPEISNWRYPSYKNRSPEYLPTESFSFYSGTKRISGTLRPERPQLIWFGFDINNAKGTYAEKLYRDQLARKAAKPVGAKTVSGTVSDSSGALPGVLISVKGTQRNVLSDVDGYFEIEAAASETLLFSYVGMQGEKIEIGDSREINLVMRASGATLGEVVVTGALGIQKKQNAMTSTQSVVSEEMAYKAEDNVLALVGKVSGLSINTSGDGADAGTRIVLRGNRSTGPENEALIVVDGAIATMSEFRALNPADVVSIDVIKGAQATAIYGKEGANGVIVVTTKKTIAALSQVKARTNLSETAFFLPHLRTDAQGRVCFGFTSPESLTNWKLRMLAHNKQGISAYLQQNIVTQKNLMVVPNFPRFFRENDSIYISAKISSMAKKGLKGSVMLELSDAASMENVDGKCMNRVKIRPISISPMGNVSIQWKIYVPEGLSGLHYRIVAQSGDFSDGEENIVPVAANRMLITESKPLWVREHTQKEVTFENLKNSRSTTLRHHKMTLEFTSNPAWLALQSLPYLMEFEHECAEQTFARFYANAIATSVIDSNPKVAGVLAAWRKDGKGALEANEELKSVLANETPWFRDALDESEQKKRLALIFDLEKMKASQKSTFARLGQKQRASGGFGWFDGSPEDEYITRHIVAGLGHLKQLGIANSGGQDVMEITKTAVPFLDDTFIRRHTGSKNKLLWTRGCYSDLHFLYARSFFIDEIPLKKAIVDEVNDGLNGIIRNRFDLSLYEKAMAALVLHRYGKRKEAQELLTHLRETSASDESNGLYWVQNEPGWYWYLAPIETQALLIEAFTEIAHDTKTTDAMKAWLIKNKQTTHWPSTKSTTEAVYALMLQGSDWPDVKDKVIFSLGNAKIKTAKLSENEKEVQTGYFKINWNPEEITRDMATLKIENKSDVPGFGGFYWQYFEDLDKVAKSEKGPMAITQELYRKVNSETGTKLQKLEARANLKVGDLITVRITIQSSEDMEYVHLKSMRASCFEPVDVHSGYESKGLLRFYKSTKDLATHYFFGSLPAGTYTLEYEVRVNNAGDFSNGITTIQSMYAPEFSAHSKGIRIRTK